MNDPTVQYDVTEQVTDALASALSFTPRITERIVGNVAHQAAAAALHEVADILRERAREHYRPLGRYEIADALEVEADRLADERPGLPGA
ncbi:hypothetical protein [Marinactinospora rubrisoli]|uniref:Uncharacterized protein n=1 Tax=Marinactinospora rubrisoli TaxID=2715399 RepID=A0ABW2KMZ0_9ACTN